MSNKTIWIFGDSYSTPFDNKGVGAWSQQYIELKGYVPKNFGDILGEELECDVMRFTEGGLCNDGIFEHIYTQAPNIKQNDIVIIGWSSIHRFRLATLANNWWNVIPNFNNFNGNTLPMISHNTIDAILINRDLPLYRKELYDRIEFLNWMFKDMKLIQWTPFKWDDIKIYGEVGVNTIRKETNGMVDDGHYSELGHRFMADRFNELLLNDSLRLKMNALHKKLI